MRLPPPHAVMSSSQSVCVLSDLHVFCKRSRAAAYEDAIHAAMEHADCCVLNGDIFDFRWTILSGIEETAAAAVDWMKAFMARYPRCRVHYVLGNHDYVRAFVEALEALADGHPRLEVHDHLFRLGDTVFLHGDAANWHMTHHEFTQHRLAWHDDRIRGRLKNRIYDIAFALRLHRLIHHIVFPQRAVAKRLLHYLDDVGHGPSTGVRAVYFGHTHLIMSGFEYQGVTFHNGGAPMHGLPFKVLTAQIEV